MPTPMLIQGDEVMLDAVLAEKFGPAAGRALLVAALELNPGLAALGPYLPNGRTILLPDAPAQTSTPNRVVVDLFG